MKSRGHVARVSLVDRRDLVPSWSDPYLTLHRLRLVNRYADGSESREYPYDVVLRKWLDAVALVLVAEIDGAPAVLLRSCVRPPLALRAELDLPLPEPEPPAFLWELPAGLLEPGDRGEAGIRRRASLEALEETGYRIDPADFERRPGATLVSSGTVPERLYYLTARVARPHERAAPRGDGSAVEERAEVEWVPLDEALAMCDQGKIEDLKTELGIRRLAGELPRSIEEARR